MEQWIFLYKDVEKEFNFICIKKHAYMKHQKVVYIYGMVIEWGGAKVLDTFVNSLIYGSCEHIMKTMNNLLKPTKRKYCLFWTMNDNFFMFTIW
jgi:hypothetical protein